VIDYLIKRTFLLCIRILNIVRGVFNIISPFYIHGCQQFCFHAFSTINGLFSVEFFFIKSYWNRNKILENLSFKFLETFYFKDFFTQDFFTQDFFSAKIKNFISENFFKIRSVILSFSFLAKAFLTISSSCADWRQSS